MFFRDMYLPKKTCNLKQTCKFCKFCPLHIGQFCPLHIGLHTSL